MRLITTRLREEIRRRALGCYRLLMKTSLIRLPDAGSIVMLGALGLSAVVSAASQQARSKYRPLGSLTKASEPGATHADIQAF
jgi:hypothetical protein